jgi:hypothetical protein
MTLLANQPLNWAPRDGTPTKDGYQSVDGYNGGSAVTSGCVMCKNVDSFSVTISFTGSTLAGTAKLQGCNDKSPTALDLDAEFTNWFDIPNSSQTNTSAAAIVWIWSQNYGPAMFRVVWTPASGTGNLSGMYTLKGPRG